MSVCHAPATNSSVGVYVWRGSEENEGNSGVPPLRWSSDTIKTARLFLLTGRNLSVSLVWGQCNNEHLVVGISNENTVSLSLFVHISHCSVSLSYLSFFSSNTFFPPLFINLFLIQSKLTKSQNIRHNYPKHRLCTQRMHSTSALFNLTPHYNDFFHAP